MRSTTPRPMAIVATAALAFGGVLLATSPAHGAPASVSDEAGLAAALADASVDEITLTADIALTGDLPAIDRDLAIDGNGHSLEGADPAYAEIILDIIGVDFDDRITVSVSDLTLAQSTETAIDSMYADLTLDGVVVDGTAGTLAFGGDLTVVGSSFSGSASDGLGFETHGVVDIRDSTFSDNGDDGIAAGIVDSADATFTGITAERNEDAGMTFRASDSSTAEVRSSSFNLNGEDGIWVEIFDDASLVIADVETNENQETGDGEPEGDGIDLTTLSSQPVTIDRLTARANVETGLEVEVLAGGPEGSNGVVNVTSSHLEGNGVVGISADTETANNGPFSNASGNGFEAAAVAPPAEPGAGIVTVTDTTIDGNVDFGVDVYTEGGGSIAVTVERSTISGSGFVGAQIVGEDDGSVAQLTLLNSTVSGNAIGVVAAGVQGADVSLHILHSTVADNSGGGGEVRASVAYINATGAIDHSIVSGTDNGSDFLYFASVAGDEPTVDHSLIGTVHSEATDLVDAGAGNIVGIDPELGPLADNGGPTLTHLPAQTSPAVNTGDPAIAQAPATDQRGAGYPRIVADIIDLGAVELPEPEPELAATGTTPAAPVAAALLTLLLGGLALAIRRRSATS